MGMSFDCRTCQENCRLANPKHDFFVKDCCLSCVYYENGNCKSDEGLRFHSMYQCGYNIVTLCSGYMPTYEEMHGGEYTVYKHIAPNNKIYVGITKQNPPSKRWNNGKGYKDNDEFWKDIQKYGWDSFCHVILDTCLEERWAKVLETKYIDEELSNNSLFGYNRNRGGFTNSRERYKKE